MPPDKQTLLRLFLGIPLPEELLEQALAAQALLKSLNPGIRTSWVRPVQMHLTLKFLGDTSLNRMQRMVPKLERVFAQFQPLGLNLSEPGVFPKPESAQVVFWGLTPEVELLAMHKELEKVLETLGFAREKRAYHPHLTLGRIRQKLEAPYRLPAFFSSERPASVWEAGQIELLQSELSSEGSRYTCLHRFRLG